MEENKLADEGQAEIGFAAYYNVVFFTHMICLVGVIWLLFYIWFPKLWKWLFDGHFRGTSMSPVADGSSSHSTSKKIKYDVFISFRGEDTRSNITSLIHSALCRKSIKAFIDKEDLKKGNEISPTLLKAIEESKLCLVILSEDYASSRWCLDELIHILQCKKTEGQVEVIPVFYKVDPSDVRKQQKSYAGAFDKLRKHFDDKKLQEWRKALDKVGNLSGWTLKESGTESQLIDSIVDDVVNKLNDMSVASRKLRGLVGIVERIKEVEQLLQIGSLNKLGPIGIWGPGGIGKTTLARAVYDRLSIHFEACAFLENVREELKKHGPTHLKEEIFSKLMDGERFQPFTKRRLRRKTVLVVFDDVDDSEHWEQLVGEWFGRESRVIITGRDQQVLKNLKVSRIYEVKGLNDHEALHLFSLHAFKKKSPTANKKELSKRAVHYAGGIPLALKVLGRHLLSRDIEAWENALNKLERFPDKNIERVLRISYDALDDTQKEIFIDIALFLNGKDIDLVQEILDDLYATDGIRVLIDKALITIGPSNTVKMHSLLQVMASQIVRPHSTNQDPIKGSRLTDAEDIYQALENDGGLETIEGISLDTSTCNREISLLPATFSKMRRLRLLKVNGSKLRLPQDFPLAFPCKLKYLNWDACPLKSLSTNFIAKTLVALDMRGSRLEKLWEGAPNLDKLKSINLSGSKHLTQVPDLSQAPNIEILNFDFCVHLTEVPSYVRHLNKLEDLHLEGCTSLCKLSELPNNLRRLQVLTRPAEHDTTRCRLGENCDELFPSLNFSSKLKMFPIILEPMQLLTMLTLEFAAIEELHPSIENLTGLRYLSLRFCAKLKFLPDSIYNLSSLETLLISYCRKLESLPVLPLSLSWLDASYCTSLKTVSSSISLVKQNWDDRNHMDRWESFEFLGCEMLDENARRVLMEEALFRILRFATIFSKYGPSRCFPELYISNWPGNEILRWFSHKSEGSSICINLPHPEHQWYNSSYLGLVFCVIVEFKDFAPYQIFSMLHMKCTYMFPNGDSWRKRRYLVLTHSKSIEEFHGDGCAWFPYDETSDKNINDSLNSEYVFVCTNNTYSEFFTFDSQKEYLEESGEYIKAEKGRFNNEFAACTTSTATFSFSLNWEKKHAKINKCGVHLLYSQEAERFGYVAESSGDDGEEEEEEEDDDDDDDSSGKEAIHSESDDQEEDHCEPVPKRFRT